MPYDVPQRLTWVAITALAIGSPFLLFPEILPLPARVPLVVGGTLAAFLLAIALVSTSRPVSYLVAVLSLTAMMAWMRVPASEMALSHLAGLGVGLLAMGVVASCCQTGTRLVLADALFLVSALAVLTLGLAGTTIGSPKFIPPWFVSWLPQVELGLRGLERGVRMTAGHVNANALAGTALLILPVGVALSFLPRQPFAGAAVVRSLGVFTGILASFVVVIAQSRSAWAAAWLTLVALGLRSGSRLRWRVLALVILLMVPSAVVMLVWSSDRTEFEQVTDNAFGTAHRRLDIWQQGIDQLKSSPWAGIGLNEFRHVYKPPVTPGPIDDVSHAHNIFLQTALDLGLVGLIAYGGLIGLLLFRSNQAARGPHDLAARTAAGAGLSLVGVHMFGLGDAISLGAKVGIFQWLAAGLVLAASRVQRRDGG